MSYYIETISALITFGTVVKKSIVDLLGGVDKFEPVSCCGEVDHAEEAAGQLIVAGRNCTVDLELAEHAFDAVALLVERPVIVDFHAAV